MTITTRPIFIGETQQHLAQQSVSGEYVTLLGDTFYRIHNYDAMPPFFMSVVSSSITGCSSRPLAGCPPAGSSAPSRPSSRTTPTTN